MEQNFKAQNSNYDALKHKSGTNNGTHNQILSSQYPDFAWLLHSIGRHQEVYPSEIPLTDADISLECSQDPHFPWQLSLYVGLVHASADSRDEL